MASERVPPFSLDREFYDQSSYAGRFRKFVEMVDPRVCLVTEQDIHNSQKLLDDFKLGKAKQASDEELWQARRVVESSVNPGTGEIIPAPLRMAAFVPMNIPLVAGMLNSTSTPAILFWQWANQSFGSACNYANRSGADLTTTEIATSYGIAVGSALGLAISFRYGGAHGPQWFRSLASLPFVVPYTAVAGAGSANVYFSRQSELVNGVPVQNEKGETVGVSKEAGKQGVYLTILSRAVGLPLPVFAIPGLAMAAVPKTVSPQLRGLIELVSITTALGLALPSTLAIFPQQLELDVNTLEPEFQKLKDDHGRPITKLYSNKGL